MGLLDHIGKQPESYAKKASYVFHKVLGAGAFGEVKQATFTAPDRSTREVAVKIMRKDALKGHGDDVFDEMNLLKGLDHQNVGAYPPATALTLPDPNGSQVLRLV